ncbi:MAG: U32 family peptidase [Desulfobacteraceae bacterium]|jgi:putative protease
MPSDHTKRVELLAPAGNFEKLEMVLHYGADAVYLAGKMFSLRNFSDNFSLDEMSSAIKLAHACSAKVYVAVNIYARNRDLQSLHEYIVQLAAIGPDGVIVSDPAMVSMVQKSAPGMPIHLSTQANTTNTESVRFWRSQGVSRINAARELSLQEIKQLSTVDGVQVEAFVQGAMCISYSGRCLLSNYMAQRPSNQGMCCQPCRFRYSLVEQTRPGQYFPIGEDDNGTYIFNSRDLCMLAHLPAMIDAGIDALKIEGRMKGIHYAATAVKIYREAIDRFYADPTDYAPASYWQSELDKITSRGYCTGFYLDERQQIRPNYRRPQPPTYALAAKVLSSDDQRYAPVEVRNQIRLGDSVEILTPAGPPLKDSIAAIITSDGRQTDVANPGDRVSVQLSNTVRRFDLLRRKVSNNVAENDTI